METAQNDLNTSQENNQSDFKANLENELVVWSAPSRPFKRRDKQFYLTTVSIAGIVCLILFLAEGAMPVILIISLIFLYYVLSTVEPEVIDYKITTKGVRVTSSLTGWEMFNRFWFSKRYDSDLLVFETKQIPNRMELVIKSEEKEKIKKVLKEYLPEDQPAATNLDKLIDWFSKKMPQ